MEGMLTGDRRRLQVADRARIEVRLRDGLSFGSIAKEIIRDKSVVSREVFRNGGREGYLAQEAELRAVKCRATSKRPNRMLPGCELFEAVISFIRKLWSPEQISGRSARMENNEIILSGLDISHEAIYLAIYAMPRGALKKRVDRLFEARQAASRSA